MAHAVFDHRMAAAAETPNEPRISRLLHEKNWRDGSENQHVVDRRRRWR